VVLGIFLFYFDFAQSPVMSTRCWLSTGRSVDALEFSGAESQPRCITGISLLYDV